LRTPRTCSIAWSPVFRFAPRKGHKRCWFCVRSSRCLRGMKTFRAFTFSSPAFVHPTARRGLRSFWIADPRAVLVLQLRHLRRRLRYYTALIRPTYTARIPTLVPDSTLRLPPTCNARFWLVWFILRAASRVRVLVYTQFCCRLLRCVLRSLPAAHATVCALRRAVFALPPLPKLALSFRTRSPAAPYQFRSRCASVDLRLLNTVLRLIRFRLDQFTTG